MKEVITNKIILTENDKVIQDINMNYDLFRSELYKSDEREDCILIQGSAFVYNKQAYLLMGVGGIDFLDSIAHLKNIDGIIGNGNTLFIKKNFKYIYSAHNSEELNNCFELECSDKNIEFKKRAKIGNLIFLLRSFQNLNEYISTKKKKNLFFEESNTFSSYPIHFSGSFKSRLRSKFISTSRVVHCSRRPSLLKKECLFDSYKEIYGAINLFKGSFVLIYTLWNQEMCDAVGMNNTRELTKSYNPTDSITPNFLKIIDYYNKFNKRL